MASVALDFRPPQETNIVALLIEEAPDSSGPWDQIERVTPVGTYPDYISNYTTSAASSDTDWFRIRWEDDKGAMSPFSSAWKAGTTTVVGELVSRALLRDPQLNENVVAQEAEAVLEAGYRVDPYTLQLSNFSYRELSGLTLLVMAYTYVSTFIQEARSSTDDYVAGLISQKSGSKAGLDMKLIDQLIAQANKALGLNFSTVLLMKEIEVAGLDNGIGRISVDQSRLVYEIEKP
jgi:hypothetical protein